jgi:hypothetical protein
MSRSGDMQSDHRAAQPRTNSIAKREARAISIQLEEDQIPPNALLAS